MLQQAYDFRDESEALYQLMEPLADAEFDQAMQFKGWTLNDVLGHLHMWNWAADLSMQDEAAFMEFIGRVMADVKSGTLRSFEVNWREGLKGQELLNAWREFYQSMAERFVDADPKLRLKWAGPDMSVLSSITARLMETWAHGQAVYDILGVERVNADRIKNVAVLGVNTFGWTYKNRGWDVPDVRPLVKLTAPSGDTWEWGDATSDNTIEGRAEEFCQVVTQTRNIADTGLIVTGEIATQWMSVAQCFAGPPEDPPAPGARHRAVS